MRVLDFRSPVPVLVSERQNFHHRDTAVQRDWRLPRRDPMIEEILDVQHLLVEIIGPLFRKDFLDHPAPVRSPTNEIAVRMPTAYPFNKAPLPLQSRPFARGRRKDILDDATHLSGRRCERKSAQGVVIGPIVLLHRHYCAHAHPIAHIRLDGEQAPEMQGVRVLATGASSTLPKAKVTVLRTREPRVGGKYALPILAELDV